MCNGVIVSCVHLHSTPLGATAKPGWFQARCMRLSIYRRPYTRASGQGSQREASVLTRSPKGPCTYMVYTWALKGFPEKSFRAQVYTIWVHGPLGIGRSLGQHGGLCNACQDLAFCALRQAHWKSSCWVLEYYTLILFLVLGSYYSYLYLKSVYFFFRVYSKAKVGVDEYEVASALIAGVRDVLGRPSADDQHLFNLCLGDDMNPKRVYGSYYLNRKYSSIGYMTPAHVPQ